MTIAADVLFNLGLVAWGAAVVFGILALRHATKASSKLSGNDRADYVFHIVTAPKGKAIDNFAARVDSAHHGKAVMFSSLALKSAIAFVVLIVGVLALSAVMRQSV